MARPMPELAPVTRAFCSFNTFSMGQAGVTTSGSCSLVGIVIMWFSLGRCCFSEKRFLPGSNHGFAWKKSPLQRMQHQPERQEHEKHSSCASEIVERAMMERLQQSFCEQVDCGDDAVESGPPQWEPLPFLHEPDHQQTARNQCGDGKLPVVNDRIPDEVGQRVNEGKPKPDE